MERDPNTNVRGKRFTQSEIEAAWSKGGILKGFDPNIYRYDACGAVMEKAKHGERMPQGFGWEIDHIRAVANGGRDDVANLQPLQWQNNRSKGDSAGPWQCAIPRIR